MASIILRNKQILRINNAKFLGIYIDDALEWDDYINHIVKQLSSGSYAIHTVKRYLSVDNLKLIYYSLIGSHLTCGTILWGSAHQFRLDKLETLQKKSIRSMCNAGYNAPKTSLFKQLCITKLMDIYNIHVFIHHWYFTYSITNNIYK